MVKVKKKSWKHEYAELVGESISYIGKHKKYIYSVTFLFFISALLGFIYSSYLGVLDPFLKEIADSTEGLDYLELIWFIFSNNVTSAVSVIFLGAFFGIFPIFNALSNGIILGYVYSKASSIAGYLVIWRLLPHGIFELPAIFISFGFGIHVGASLFGPNKIKTLKARLKKSMTAFLAVVVPLLILAAVIEGTLIFLI